MNHPFMSDDKLPDTARWGTGKDPEGSYHEFSSLRTSFRVAADDIAADCMVEVHRATSGDHAMADDGMGTAYTVFMPGVDDVCAVKVVGTFSSHAADSNGDMRLTADP